MVVATADAHGEMNETCLRNVLNGANLACAPRELRIFTDGRPLKRFVETAQSDDDITPKRHIAACRPLRNKREIDIESHAALVVKRID
jgi:hypothetical protein